MLGAKCWKIGLLEIEWDEIYRESTFDRIVVLHHKTYILGLQCFLRDEFKLWAGNGRSVEDIRKKFKGIIFEDIKRYVTQKSLSKNWDLQYYKKIEKRLK